MSWLSPLFIIVVCAGTALELGLGWRQEAMVRRHRARVPEPFADRVSAQDHARAADYTIARVRFHRLQIVIGSIVTLTLTLGGVVATLDAAWRRLDWSEPWLGTAVILSVGLLTTLLNLPFSLWRTFRLEARFGFNRITPRLFLADLLKGAALTVLIGTPAVLLLLQLMARAGDSWWLWAWAAWLALTLLMTWAWPILIAPLFNKFSPLQDSQLRQRIESLLQRCGFAAKGVFVVDGSARSAHGNAYFTGIGRHKRIVFFDTLLQHLGGAEIEAVLAHELGHFKLKHVSPELLGGLKEIGR